MAGVMTGGVAVAGTPGLVVYGAAACAYVCGAASGTSVAVSGGALCFDDGMQVELPDGSSIPVERLVKGNKTLAMDIKGERSLSHAIVVYAKREQGSFAGRQLVLGHDHRGITVTDSHLMFLVVNGEVVLREAQHLVAGDFLLPSVGIDASFHPLELTAIKPVVMGVRNIIATSEGTISVEGLTTSAMCDAPSTGSQEADNLEELMSGQSAAQFVELWKAGHVNRELVL